MTGLAAKPVTPHGTAPRRGRSEGTAWEGKGRRLAKSKRGGHGRGGGVWAVGCGRRAPPHRPGREGQTARAPRPSPGVRLPPPLLVLGVASKATS